MALDVIGFGAMNVDRLYRVDHIANSGEEVNVLDFIETPGGSAANTVVGLARLGIRTGYIGIVSNDNEGILLLEDLKQEGVDTKGIIVSESNRTGIVNGYIDKKGERTLYVDPGINDGLEYKNIDIKYANETKYLHLSSFVGDKPFTSQKRLVTDLTKDVKVSFDPGDLYAKRGLSSLVTIIRRTHVFFPNRQELKLLTGKDFKEGSMKLVEMGVHIVAVKMGNKGCYITNGDENHSISPYGIDAIDTTGAGDAFCAGFLYGLLKNKSLQICGKMGNYLASCCIRKNGARSGLPKVNTVFKRL